MFVPLIAKPQMPPTCEPLAFTMPDADVKVKAVYKDKAGAAATTPEATPEAETETEAAPEAEAETEVAPEAEAETEAVAE